MAEELTPPGAVEVDEFNRDDKKYRVLNTQYKRYESDGSRWLYSPGDVVEGLNDAEKDSFGDNFEELGGSSNETEEGSEPESEGFDSSSETAQELAGDIKDGEYDDMLDEVKEDEEEKKDRVTVLQAIEHRKEELE